MNNERKCKRLCFILSHLLPDTSPVTSSKPADRDSLCEEISEYFPPSGTL